MKNFINFIKRHKLILIIIASIATLVYGSYLFLWLNINFSNSYKQKINLGEPYQLDQMKYFDKVLDKSTYQTSGVVDSNKVGTYKIKYKVNFLFLKFIKNKYVEVVDNTLPTISLKGEDIVYLCPNQNYEELGFNATDNYDGDLTNKVAISKEENDHEILIKYVIKDSSNNTSIQTRKVIKEDKIAPVITFAVNDEIIFIKDDYNKEYTILDNCSKEDEIKVNISGEVNNGVEGDYTLAYEAIDKYGNSSIYRKKVKVKKKYKVNYTEYNPLYNGKVYLTFDDGPSSSITPKILDVLKKHNVKATFFVINKSSNLDYLITRAYNEGHTVAPHSASHDFKKIYASEQAFFDDYNLINNKIIRLTNNNPKILRFAGGSSNTVSRFNKGIMSSLATSVLGKGIKFYDWNVGSSDVSDISSSQVVRNVTRNLSKSRPNIVLMHDFENNYKTLNALEDIIIYGKNNGYKFDKITNDVPIISHNIAN